ncbi:MAG: oxidoreductase [Chloroflexi bacterium]|nr:oxidoreductase [Chloroflexota bacterium]
MAAVIEDLFADLLDDGLRRDLRWWLTLLDNGLVNWLTSGRGGRFADLPQADREAVLRTWAESRVPAARKAFHGVKRLALFVFYSRQPDPAAPNPTWAAFNYHGPDRDPPPTVAADPIQPLAITGPTTLSADVLVIGSGAGGGVVAGELAAAGHDVLVIEKGAHYRDSEFHGREYDSTQALFERSGVLTTRDLSMQVLAGSVLGGGTTINWSASLRPPQSLLHEWAHDHGFGGALSSDYARSVEAVFERTCVNAEASAVNPQNCALSDGCAALGYDVSTIPRNVDGCTDCSFCNFGCAAGTKQSTLKTYLRDAVDHGARIVVRGHVERVLIERGQAVGAAVTVTDAAGAAHAVTVRARIVVVAAGALHTPALLLRSGLANANIGANLHLHPTTLTYGIFAQPIRGWDGVPMSRMSSEFVDLDGAGYGVRLETAPIHPGLAGLMLRWTDAHTHRATMGQLERIANVIAIVRDRHGGRIRIDGRGQPVLDYRLHPYDADHLRRGMIEALRVHHAAGAVEVSSGHYHPLIYHRGNGRWPSFESFLAAVADAPLHPNTFTLSSAHQMASCRIGGDTALGALDPTGQSYEIRNLYVADASALPTATGVNPMMTIMGTAHYIAQQIKAAL